MTNQQSAISGQRPAAVKSDVSTFRRFDVSPRAFTLIELMVVVGIIVMLVGLTVGVSVILHQKSETRQVEQVLKLLDTALQEWELAADRQFSWGKDGVPIANSRYDLQCDATGVDQMASLLARLQSSTASKAILSRIDPELFVNDTTNPANPFLKILDPWDMPIIALHAGRLPNSLFAGDGPAAKDDDGTIHTAPGHPDTPATYVSEVKFGSCVNRRICFISAGPDGRFGDLATNEDFNGDGVPDQQDNIYSYPLVKP